MPRAYQLELEDGSLMGWVYVCIGEKITHIMEYSYNHPKYLETFTILSKNSDDWFTDRLKELKVKNMYEMLETGHDKYKIELF